MMMMVMAMVMVMVTRRLLMLSEGMVVVMVVKKVVSEGIPIPSPSLTPPHSISHSLTPSSSLPLLTP